MFDDIALQAVAANELRLSMSYSTEMVEKTMELQDTAAQLVTQMLPQQVFPVGQYIDTYA